MYSENVSRVKNVARWGAGALSLALVLGGGMGCESKARTAEPTSAQTREAPPARNESVKQEGAVVKQPAAKPDAKAGAETAAVTPGTIKRVTGAEAQALVKDGALLLDVRSTGEYASEGAIKGSKNIPVNELSKRLAEVGDPKRPVVVYCLSGARSAFAAKVLQRAGFRTIYDMGTFRAYPKTP